MRFTGMILMASVNPARAGMIPGVINMVVGARGKPRASGDDPATWRIW